MANYVFMYKSFLVIMESVMRKAGVHRKGLIFQKTLQSLAYADDIIARSKRDVSAAFNAVERESTRMCLAVNEGKTKYSHRNNDGFICLLKFKKINKFLYFALKKYFIINMIFIKIPCLLTKKEIKKIIYRCEVMIGSPIANKKQFFPKIIN